MRKGTLGYVLVPLGAAAVAVLSGCALATPRTKRVGHIGGEFEHWRIYAGPPPVGTFGSEWFDAVRRVNGEWVATNVRPFACFYKDGYCFWKASGESPDGSRRGSYWFAARDGEKGLRWFRKSPNEKMGNGSFWDEEALVFTDYLGKPQVGWQEFKEMYEKEALRCRDFKLDGRGEWKKGRVDVIREP